MKKEIINILIQSKGRMAPFVEKIFKKNKLKIIKQSERSLIGMIEGYPSIKIKYMNTSEIIEALAKNIGKTAALVGVCPGFVGNRILAQRQREANKLILEGALPWEIDDALFDFGFPMGPFAMSDLAGLDIGWDKETSRGETIRDILCENERFGQKSGKGFYIYDDNRNKLPDNDVEKIIQEFADSKQIKRREIQREEILQRCLYPMVNEGFKILDEGMAIRASDIDIIWINGYGWPIYEGGPMFYGSLIGYDKILSWLQEMEKEHGSDFTPSPYLEKVVEEKINIFN